MIKITPCPVAAAAGRCCPRVGGSALVASARSQSQAHGPWAMGHWHARVRWQGA